MTRQDHLLVILMEECAEVQKECAKALRFGLDDWYAPAGPETNRESISREFDDLVATMDLLRHEGVIPFENEDNLHRQDAKVAKIEKFLEYSEKAGTLA
jgi:hypothetical protein